METRNLFGTTFRKSDFAQSALDTTGSIQSVKSVIGDGKLAGMSFHGLLDKYRHDLFEDYLPYLNKYAVDHEYGGFMCNAYPDGTRIDTDKRAWYEGRGLWVFSCLYNRLGTDPVHYEFARKTVDFILKLKPEGDSFWPGASTREGKPLAEGEIYGDLFIALGLQEYSRISGNEYCWDEAKEILTKCVRIYDSPDYPGKPFLADSPDITAPRMLGHWMMLIRVATQMLETRQDPEVETIAARCVDALMNHHYNHEYGLFNEVLNHDFSRPDNMYARWSYTGHAIEVLWFLFEEALRLKDIQLFNTAAERFMRHIEVSWDSVYGGVFRSINDVKKNIRLLDVVLLFQVEALNGCMLLAEHTGSRWAADWYEKFFNFIQDRYDLRQHGYSPWMSTGDRTGTPPEFSSPRIGNFHYPQALIVNILSLERIIERGGKVSDCFA